MTALAIITCNGKTIRVNPLLHPDQLCYGQRCYLRMPGVCRDLADTVVPCHSNQLRHGKGRGLKADDAMTVPGCFWCHQQLDQGARYTYEQKLGFFYRGMWAWAPYREVMYGVPALPCLEALE